MTATTTRLPVPEWRLLNVLHVSPDLRIDRALERSSAEVNDVDELSRKGFIYGTYGGDEVDIAAAPPVQMRNLRLHLKPAGTDWVTGNPMNTLLRSLDMKPNKRMRLDEVLGFTADGQVVLEALETGFATLHHAAGQREVPKLNGDREFRNARSYTLNATSKARRVLG